MGICYNCMCSIEQNENGYCKECIEKILKQRDWTQLTVEPKAYEQGWVCPKCGAVMSPRQQYCLNCSGNMVNKSGISCDTGPFDAYKG